MNNEAKTIRYCNRITRSMVKSNYSMNNRNKTKLTDNYGRNADYSAFVKHDDDDGGDERGR